MKCLFVFGLTKAERAQVGEDVRTFRRVKHPALLALQDVISEPEVGRTTGQLQMSTRCCLLVVFLYV